MGKSTALYKLPMKEKNKIENIVKKLDDGFKLNAYKKSNKFVNTKDVLLMETNQETGDNNTRKRKYNKINDEKIATKLKVGKPRKNSRKKNEVQVKKKIMKVK